MNSLILNAATRLLVGLLLLFSIYMLLRGHNLPGGGFIGGLIGATGFVLYAIAHGCSATRAALRVDPQSIAMVGLGIALAAGVFAAFFGDALFTGQWLFIGETEDDKGLPISSVLFFDIGVYLVVFGSILTIVLALEEEV
ncbi:Na+/H+ antiporter subunit B [Roseobacter sp. HKCCD9010]|nr:Na+/H+ antiporter subunit B [Rhodobacterales bacterium HKCCD4356]NNV10850.1 Na+/H+ antiporter subunit B [Roseobacter sp. HKCCD7357]NNV15035.1 Na+/H+ antiporter subunit B [Roseobacter sp. HKCCD8768]NNV24494.1 Na+/H+ antiporter subunit B [Roseobacter sp. HKCCD8192]NNV28751.1 Na+/H+ antiporter subunit B [Roseobacter sp. HKCCD9061]NNV33024.1 Na+/H+ antiporter subunit B [Roseobacter sp. HKCCD9073]NNV37275.1 Na+/H+ antiporter subunit B [Roseobacter sp. HKCCD9054]NNV41232.1 Na+/H+ antiporter sub